MVQGTNDRRDVEDAAFTASEADYLAARARAVESAAAHVTGANLGQLASAPGANTDHGGPPTSRARVLRGLGATCPHCGRWTDETNGEVGARLTYLCSGAACREQFDARDAAEFEGEAGSAHADN